MRRRDKCIYFLVNAKIKQIYCFLWDNVNICDYYKCNCLLIVLTVKTEHNVICKNRDMCRL